MMLTRRPNWSWVRDWKSKSGSSPRRLRRKPPLPLRLPWQAPILQPAFESRGTMSVRKLAGRFLVARSTRIPTWTDKPQPIARRAPLPSAKGLTTPSGLTAAIPVGSTTKRQSRVTSRSEPSFWRRVTATCWRDSAPERATVAGSMVRLGESESPRAPIHPSPRSSVIIFNVPCPIHRIMGSPVRSRQRLGNTIASLRRSPSISPRGAVLERVIDHGRKVGGMFNLTLTGRSQLRQPTCQARQP